MSIAKKHFLCERCRRALLIYKKARDAWWCPRCDRWAEDVCGDEACEPCRDRPATPSQDRTVKVAA